VGSGRTIAVVEEIFDDKGMGSLRSSPGTLKTPILQAISSIHGTTEKISSSKNAQMILEPDGKIMKDVRRNVILSTDKGLD